MRVPLVARAVDDVFPLSLQVFKCEESMPSPFPLHNSAPSDECRVDKNALVPPLPLLLQKISLFHIDNETMFMLAFFLFIGCRFRPILLPLKGVSKSLGNLSKAECKCNNFREGIRAPPRNEILGENGSFQYRWRGQILHCGFLHWRLNDSLRREAIPDRDPT